MGIHSKFLVHWTGNGNNDIESKPKSTRPRLYLERLIDCYQNGLFAKRTDEDVLRGMMIKDIVRLCFTEIRLSQVETHAKRYGNLGIGFSRDFIMNKGGRPVIYIPFEPKEDGSLLEVSIKNAYNNSKENKELRESMKWIISHIKRMSNEKGKDYYFEEMEWRLVYDESPNNRHFKKDKAEGIYRLNISASDIKVIIFPDEDTMQMSLKNDTIIRCLSVHMPIMAILEDCRNF
jgi:hypothetical protein